MSTTTLEEDAKSIVALNAWSKAAAYNWVLVPQTSEEPIIVHVDAKSNGPVAGRLMFFPGFAAYRDFALLLQAPDLGLALSPLDVTHWELVGLTDGRYEIHSFRTGFVPHLVDKEEQTFLAPLVHECRGLLMRFEEDTELPAKYAADQAMFGRKEGLDGKWRDGPVPLPKEPPRPREERIALGSRECAVAARLPFNENESWEVDFFGVPACRTEDPQPRIMYLFAAVDAQTGERRVWDRMSVPKNGGTPEDAGGLKPMWESLAQRLLAAILRHGRIPGAVNVRSGRMARFLRPLGLQIPFRLVQHGKLPALDAALANAFKTKTV